MIPEILIGPGKVYKSPQDPEWQDYLSRIGEYADTIEHEFLAEIFYEHGRRFSDYFPGFDLATHQINRRLVTAYEILHNVRYDLNGPGPDWSHIFDEQRSGLAPYRYTVYDHMVQNGTWSFPPVIIDNTGGIAQHISSVELGRPWHLIEGTHRVSFLKRMLELDLVKQSSKHEIFWLSQ